MQREWAVERMTIAEGTLAMQMLKQPQGVQL
jgi:hypothetical protein